MVMVAVWPNWGKSSETPTPVASQTTMVTTWAQPSVSTEPLSVVPEVIGLTLDEARAHLRSVGLRSSEDDASPRNRSVWIDSNWTVVATDPLPGGWPEDGRTVSVWYLRNEEATWFSEHPTMPKLRAGKDTSSLTDEGGVLDGMDELIEYRWARGHKPKDAFGAESYGLDLVVSSIPAAGEPIEVGQLLVVTERGAPEDSYEEPTRGTSGPPKKYTGPRCYSPGGRTWHPC